MSKKEKVKRKNAVYRIDDNYFRFYYLVIGKDIEYEGSEISALSLDDLVGM